MARAPIPSAEEIIHLYETGELAAELARYHEGPAEAEETFLQRCIELHNNRKIDLSHRSEFGLASQTLLGTNSSPHSISTVKQFQSSMRMSWH